MNIHPDTTVVVLAPTDVTEILWGISYLPPMLQCTKNVYLLLPEFHQLRALLEPVLPGVYIIDLDEYENITFELELQLSQLPDIFKDHDTNITLQPSCEKVLFFQKIINCTRMLNIGLAFYGDEVAPLNNTVIAHNITLQQLHWTTFFPIPYRPETNNPANFNNNNAADFVKDYGDLAAMLSCLDILISLENDAAYLAAALGKPVWLFVPQSSNSSKLKYLKGLPNVSVFSSPQNGNWKEAVRNMALFRLFQPSSDHFTPFKVCNMKLELPAALPIPNLTFHNTSDLSDVLDADLATITSVSIETTTVCNLKCSYCPHSTEFAKQPSFMQENVYYRIIDSLLEYLPTYSGIIVPSMYGEPLLDKRLETFVNYARKKFPSAWIDLYTNGHFLTRDRFRSLQQAGIDQFHISEHTTDHSAALSRTLTTLQKEQKEPLPIKMVNIAESNKFNRGGLVPGDVIPLEARKKLLGCSTGYQNLVFDHKGNSILCCNDYLSKHTFGNIASKSVQEIWEDKAYRQTRNMIMLGFLPFPMCRTCLDQ